MMEASGMKMRSIWQSLGLSLMAWGPGDVKKKILGKHAKAASGPQPF